MQLGLHTGGAALIISTDPAHSLSDALDQDVSGGLPVEVRRARHSCPASACSWALWMVLHPLMHALAPFARVPCQALSCCTLPPGARWAPPHPHSRCHHMRAPLQVDGTEGRVFGLELDVEQARAELRHLSG